MEKLKIIAIDGSATGTVVEAQFNPKELDILKMIPWQQQPGKGPSDLIFTNSEPRTMTFELQYDAFQTLTSIQGEIDKLQMLSDIDTVMKRPPKLKVSWGPEGGGMPKFEAVVTELVVKYTMVDPNSKPLRATALLKLREAKNIVVKTV